MDSLPKNGLEIFREFMRILIFVSTRLNVYNLSFFKRFRFKRLSNLEELLVL